MKPITSGERVVRNIFSSPFRPFDNTNIDYKGASYLPIDEAREPATGFHVFRMEPGATSTPHEHTCDEFFLLLEGEFIDNDGTRYNRGDMVMLRAGTQHSSYTPTGCTLLVYIDTIEKPLETAK